MKHIDPKETGEVSGGTGYPSPLPTDPPPCFPPLPDYPPYPSGPITLPEPEFTDPAQ